jgi:hypothetical protein
MGLTRKALSISCLIAVCIWLALPEQACADVESVLAEINRKPAEERLKLLINGGG